MTIKTHSLRYEDYLPKNERLYNKTQPKKLYHCRNVFTPYYSLKTSAIILQPGNQVIAEKYVITELNILSEQIMYCLQSCCCVAVSELVTVHAGFTSSCSAVSP